MTNDRQPGHIRQQSVTPAQRFTPDRPCPICQGYDKAPRGRGVRCYGFLSEDGEWANCTSTDAAGTLPVNPSSETYAHHLTGSCKCGTRHDPWPDAPAPKAAKAPRGEVEAVYDYQDENGTLLFQALRLRLPDGGKSFSQRRPDGQGGWIWRLSNVRRVLYRLPELVEAPLEETIWVVEGEKDANRLCTLGAVATTNPQGALKWRGEYSEMLRDRHVVIIPDNDPPSLKKPTEHYKGQKHAMLVAKSVYPFAASVKVLELPGLPSKGDVSDWLDAGGTLEQLHDLAAAQPLHTPDTPYSPAGSNGAGTLEELEATQIIWLESKYRPVSRKFIQEGLLRNGYFISAEGRLYYFHDATKAVCELDSFDMKVLLNETYQLNDTETFYKFLLSDMKVEAYTRGRAVRVSSFAHYAPDEDLLYLSLSQGSMLRLDGREIQVVDNGSEGVLFTQSHQEAWTFVPDPNIRLIGGMLMRPMPFTSDPTSPHTPEEQQMLLLIWMLSIAFETMQPTKPLALALGPAGSGKSSMFRRIGRMLYGPSFEVEGIRKDGEDDFFVATTNSAFVAFDNVDRYVPWLEDALATSATGTRITKKVLYTTNQAISFVPRAFIALTARTPHFRRDDVSERMLPFRLDRLTAKRPEYDLLKEVVEKRNLLMSEYAYLLNKALAVKETPKWDMGLRLADFGQVALRIGASWGRVDETIRILEGLQTSQKKFATEESDLVMLLAPWTEAASRAGSLDVATPNDGRWISTEALYSELKVMAEQHGYKWDFKNPIALGKNLDSMREALGVQFEVGYKRARKGSLWQFSRKHVADKESKESNKPVFHA